MPSAITTKAFSKWLDRLRDKQAQRKIAARILQLEAGLLGDWKSVGGKVSELRVNYGPGYRLYFTGRGNEVVILLCGGDKSSQEKDIKAAQEMVRELE